MGHAGLCDNISGTLSYKQGLRRYCLHRLSYPEKCACKIKKPSKTTCTILVLWFQRTCSTLCDQSIWPMVSARGAAPQFGANVRSPRNLARTCVWATCKSGGTSKSKYIVNKALLWKSTALQRSDAEASRRRAARVRFPPAQRFPPHNAFSCMTNTIQRLQGRRRTTWANNAILHEGSAPQSASWYLHLCTETVDHKASL